MDKTVASKFEKGVLKAAALYNVIWGTSVVLFPNVYFQVLGMEPPIYTMIWQCLGMVIGVYGVGYYLASFDPVRHYPIVLVGFLGKIFGPIGFVFYLLQGGLPIYFGIVLIFNDLIWWIPFFSILRKAFRGGELKTISADS